MARGKSNHIFPAGHNIFCVTVSACFNWGKIYDIFSPCVFIFSPCVFIFFLLGLAINCSTFTDGVLGENMARGKFNHIFPAGHNIFCVTVRHRPGPEWGT
jgi:hypothetical protein